MNASDIFKPAGELAKAYKGAKRGPKPKVDWDAVHRMYRESNLTMIELSKITGISANYLYKQAKARKWVRGRLNARVAAEVEAELVRRVGDELLSDEAIQAAAKTTADVIRTHRIVATDGRTLVARLMQQLDFATKHRAALEDAIMQDGDTTPTMKRRYLEAVELPAQVSALKTLSVAAANFVTIEREAFGLAKGARPEGEGDDRDTIEAVTPEEAQEAYRKMLG